MSEVRPAMTPEEWLMKGNSSETVLIAGDKLRVVPAADAYPETAHPFPDDDRHALAALALHGQPFGFTWADVDLLWGEAQANHYHSDGMYTEEGEHLLTLADRIAALLSPR